MKAAAILALLVACASPDAPPSIDHARPPWGPLAGGITIDLVGSGFDPYVNRVYIAGREAPVVRTIDEGHLEVVIPPGLRDGDAEVVVVTAHDNVIANGVFRYSTPPAIDDVSPAKVIMSNASTTITVHGSGFVDEEAGTPVVLVDGQAVPEVDVRDDSRLTFEAPAGTAFTRAQIQVINQRGAANARGPVYAPSERPGLLAFGMSGDLFATFYDPTTGDLTSIPHVSTSSHACIYGVIRDGAGTYWASVYCALPDWGYGRIDLGTQTLVDGNVTGQLYPTLARHRGTVYVIQYQSNRFGTLDESGTVFTPVGTATFPCCDFGLASDDKTLWVASRDGTGTSIRTIDPATGVMGTAVPVALPVNYSITDLRWFEGTIYGTTSAGYLVSIDPATGVVNTIVYVGTSYALEVFE